MHRDHYQYDNHYGPSRNSAPEAWQPYPNENGGGRVKFYNNPNFKGANLAGLFTFLRNTSLANMSIA